MEDILIPIERSLWTGDSDVFREHVDGACLMVLPGMVGVSEREEVAESVEGPTPRWRQVEIEVEGVLRPTDDVVLLAYRASAVRGDGTRYRAMISSGYVARGDEWKLMFHQQAPLDV